ncbi:N-acetylmuramoyl-L-alanine amidase family protein [Formosa haliotis]|uniref:N-acetylmuramoyl-L-alanine amidase family protein n=1 Tax=Formosa haliotis TaxID=1555194 RepID=UPI0008263F95|nr:N-acetylmuramoyl-L-alanine amidase [Formosa haliotis]
MKTHAKFILKNVSFLLIFLNMGILTAQENSWKKVVVIDPGHGGTDPGAIGVYHNEKEITLNIGLELLKWHQILFKNKFDVYLTRSKDTLISLYQRSQMAKAIGADVFVSIHCNAGISTAKGFEVFIPQRQNQYSNQSSRLALSIIKECNQHLGFASRGIKTADFSVLRQSILDYPAILIELGFLTHCDEGLYFSHQKHNSAMALAILMGLVHFLNL